MWTMKRQRRDEVDEAVVAAEVVTVRVLQARHADQALPIFAAPGRCLRCDDMALVERVDDAAGRAHHRCLACGAAWTMSRAALRRAAVEDRDRAAVVAGGTLVEPLVAGAPPEDVSPMAVSPEDVSPDPHEAGARAGRSVRSTSPRAADPSWVAAGVVCSADPTDAGSPPSAVTSPPPARSLRVGAAPRVRFVV